MPNAASDHGRAAESFGANNAAANMRHEGGDVDEERLFFPACGAGAVVPDGHFS